MIYSQDLISRFQELYLAKFGQKISSEAAERQLKQLAGLVRIITKKQP